MSSLPSLRRLAARRTEATSSPTRGRGRLDWLISLAVFLGVACLASWPLVLHLGTQALDQGDTLFTSWSLPWVVHSLLHHPTRLFQANAFHPEPDALAYADHMTGLSPVAAPFWLLTHNGVLTNNATTIVLLTLAGWSAYLLAREVTGSRAAAGAAGIFFAFAPYHASHLTHTNLMSTYPLALVVLFTLRVVRRGRPRDGVLLTVSWILAALSSWYYLVFSSMAVVVVGAAESWFRRRTTSLARSGALVACAGTVTLLVCIPFAVPYFHVQDRYPQAARPLREAEHYAPGPSAFVAAPGVNRVYGKLTERFVSGGSSEKMFFVGLTPLLLAVAGAVRAVRTRRPALVVPYAALAAAALLIGAGPYQTLAGTRHQMPFYYLYQALPAIRFMRSMGRSGVYFALVVSVLVAVALAGVRRRADRIVLCAAVSVLMVAELASAPRQLGEAPRQSLADLYLARSKQPGAVLELPTALYRDGRVVDPTHIGDAKPMAASTVHWRPILNGYSGFIPPSYAEMVREVQTFPSPASLRFLASRDVVFVVVRTTRLAGTPWEGLAATRELAGLRFELDDGEARVYTLLR